MDFSADEQGSHHGGGSTDLRRHSSPGIFCACGRGDLDPTASIVPGCSSGNSTSSGSDADAGTRGKSRADDLAKYRVRLRSLCSLAS